MHARKRMKMQPVCDGPYCSKSSLLISGSSYPLCKTFLLNKENDVLQNDKLTIKCQIILKGDILCSALPNNLIDVPNSTLSGDLDSFLQNKKFSDVNLFVDGHDFYAHKVILSARSPVFKAMFDHDMIENQNNCVVIKDVKQEVIREMLRYIYTDVVDNIGALAGELLVVANKYDLERLKCMCEQAICRELSAENAVDILILADLHSARSLKTRAFNFIIENAEHLVDTEAFQAMEKTHPHFAMDVFRTSFKQLQI